jgi:hypothetical protein
VSVFPRTVCRWLLPLVICVPCAWSQINVGETTLSSNALVGFGYSNTMQTNSPDLSSTFVTASGSLNGSYHDPKFLNYNISPYLNQSNLNSNYNSSTFASGINGTANFLSASRTPMQLTYAYAHDSEGTFNVPGQLGSYKTVGNGQDIGFSAAWLSDDLPSLRGSIAHGNSDYEVIGQPGTGTSRNTSANIGSSYEVWDTQLNGSYTKNWSNSDAPLFGSQDRFLQTDVNQSTWQLAGTRQFFGKSSLTGNYSHVNVDDNYANSLVKTSYSTVNSLYTITPVRKLNLNTHVSYSSDLSAQYVSGIIGNPQSLSTQTNAQAASSTSNTTTPGPYLSFTSNYLNYGGGASYHITNGWWVNGTVDRIEQGVQNSNTDISSSDAGVGTVFSHALLGGAFGASYSVTYFWSPVLLTVDGVASPKTQTVLGQAASASYSHRVLGWTATGSGTYGRGITTVVVGQMQDQYSANASLARQWASWNLNATASYLSSHIENVSIADNSANNYSLSLGRHRWGVSGTYSRSNGSGFQVGSSIVPVIPVPTVPGQVPQLLTLYKGESWGAGGTWQPVKRMTIYGSFSHVHYDAMSLAVGASANVSEQGYLRAQYYWRQLIFNAGYSYLQQSLGQPLLTGPGSPKNMQTVFFGVSRRFDFF